MRVFARKSAAVDPAATRGVRPRRDAALQPVCPAESACQRLHVHYREPLPQMNDRSITTHPEPDPAPFKSALTDESRTGHVARAASRCERFQ